MSGPIIRARGVGKRFQLGESGPKYGTLGDALSNLRRRGERAETGVLWALRAVDFDIFGGEAVGIVGRNGAGKSTLLKILSRITPPSEGRIELFGRVASLLEVGTGFHGELTGRENIFFNGAILGMRRHEIARRFDEIVAFSEVNKFIDTPVKRYSSGMTMKLAFAVAAHLEPEILVVDEVLAVGDAAFQRKCLGKMRDVAGQGRTVLFVSHQMQAVSTLTTRAILLHGGRVALDGSTPDVIAAYLTQNEDAGLLWQSAASESEPRLTRVEVFPSEPGSVTRNGAPLEIEVEVCAPRAMRDPSVSVQACNDLEQPVLWVSRTQAESAAAGEAWGGAAGTFRLRCRVPHLHLYRGRYTLRVRLGAGGRHVHEIDGICPFEVVMWGQDNSFGWTPRAAAYTEESEWRLTGSSAEPLASGAPG